MNQVEEAVKPTGDGARSERHKRGFTRGPWWYRNGYVYHRNAKDRAGRSKSYAICGVSLPGANEMLAATGEYGTSGQSKAIRDANGTLLAAAPALYEAVKELIGVEYRHGSPAKREAQFLAAIEQGRAALALVDGPQNQETK